MIPWTKIFIGLAIVSLIFGGYRFVSSHLEHDAEVTTALATAKNNADQYALALSYEKEVRELERERTDDALNSLEMVQGEMAESRRTTRELVRVFDAGHDLAALIKNKPGLVTRRMRDGTERMWRQLEQAGGSSEVDGDTEPVSEPTAD